MKTYTFEAERILTATFEVKAESRLEALSLAEEKMGNLGLDDWEDTGDSRLVSLTISD